jgi:hypothetical protein
MLIWNRKPSQIQGEDFLWTAQNRCYGDYVFSADIEKIGDKYFFGMNLHLGQNIDRKLIYTNNSIGYSTLKEAKEECEKRVPIFAENISKLLTNVLDNIFRLERSKS